MCMPWDWGDSLLSKVLAAQEGPTSISRIHITRWTWLLTFVIPALGRQLFTGSLTSQLFQMDALQDVGRDPDLKPSCKTPEAVNWNHLWPPRVYFHMKIYIYTYTSWPQTLRDLCAYTSRVQGLRDFETTSNKINISLHNLFLHTSLTCK